MLTSIADAFATFVRQFGPRTAFTVPGSSCLPILDAMSKGNISIVLSRDETAAVHAAHGYAAAMMNAFGCCILSRGPGAANAMCGMLTACEGYPVLLIAGDNKTKVRGKKVVTQDVDLEAVFSGVVPTFVIEDSADFESILGNVRHLLLIERQSVVLIVPSDIQEERISISCIDRRPPANSIGERPTNAEAIDGIVEQMARSRNPLLIWGRDALRNDTARSDILSFMESRPDLHCVVTMKGLEFAPKGCRGILGTQGHYSANALQHDSDCVLVIGECLGAEAVGSKDTFSANRQIISLSLSDQHQNFILPNVEARIDFDDLPVLFAALRGKLEVNPTSQPYETAGTDTLNELLSILRLLPDQTVITLDSGQNFFWAAHALISDPRFRSIYSYEQGTMGFAVPAAIGACLHDPRRPSIAIVGDGGILMSVGELDTICTQNLPIKIILIDNSGLGMVRQTQIARGMREVATGLPNSSLLQVATGFGLEVCDFAEADEAILRRVLKSNAPSLIRILVDPRRRLLLRGAAGSPLPLAQEV